MKRFLYGGALLAGLVSGATPAAAQLEIDLGGFYRGYAVYADTDLDVLSSPLSSDDLREFDLAHDAEIHFTGETTLDNGLTIGFHAEHDLGADAFFLIDRRSFTDEVYVYFQGPWGRINLGQEDGAGYLLQVAAPSADSNVDGLRATMQKLNIGGSFFGLNLATIPGVLISGQSTVLDYDMAQGRYAEKITYLTPKFSGFQAGLSWAPEVSDDCADGDPGRIGGPSPLACYANGNAVGNNIFGMNFDDKPGAYEHLVELAARWDGEFDRVGVSIGGGWSRSHSEAPLFGFGIITDDRTQWNIGANITFGEFSLGGVWMEDDNFGDLATETHVIGVGWDRGPWHAGASWLSTAHESVAGAGETTIDRYTLGGTYTFGPGMTFRAAVSVGEADMSAFAAPFPDVDLTQVTVGTEVNF